VKDRTEVALERVRDRARSREKSALGRMVALGAISILVGVALSLYARRALAPLAVLTRRANEVAAGDLAPREAPRDATEIGELGRTFEAMVRSVRDARAELVKAERLAVVGQMAAKITHEVRNPLSAIGLNLELLEAELAEGEGDVGEARELCVAMQREVQRLTQLSQQYLSLARRPAPELVPEPLGDLVAEVVAFLKPELDRGGVRAELELDPSAPPVALDEGLLRQALHNLLRNAREAMPDGGTIRVRLGTAEGGGVDLAIEDEGEGVPDALRATIFDPFVTTKSGGTGLGLAVTREIVEAHGGLVACEPRTPRGTRFVLHFPSADEAPRATAALRDDQPGTG
jgi:signal transduction histidine kinase